MNSQLPPIDSEIREQLTRRSAGRLPDGLLAEVSNALDGVREPRGRARWPRLAWSMPRLAGAGVGVALVAILAIAIASPAFHTGPVTSLAGYPTDRALTTDELARLMAGPQLPTNTTLVASVTIDAKTDVCPMDRYPTIGVVEGMRSQVCVMGAGVSAYLNTANASGTFAFRYLAPGVLGLIGQVAPASSTRLAHRVTDDWPLAGQTFVVEGWLGATQNMKSCFYAPTAGDVLLPNGDSGCGYSNWLSDDGTPPVVDLPTPTPDSSTAGAGLGSDAFKPYGEARLVQAEGVRIIDSIDHASPTLGVYVVRSVVGPCAGDPPQSSRGCGAWRVLAKVADISLPGPIATPTATGTAASSAGYPTDRALTTAELAHLMAGPQLPTNATLVASTTIDIRTDVCPMNSRPTVGIIQGVDPQVCVMGATLSAQLPGPTAHGVFAFRYMAPGYLGLLGEITPASSSKVAFKVADGWPLAGKTFLVEGWLGAYLISCPTYIATSGGDPLDPDGQDQCAFNWLTDDPTAEPSTSPNGLLPPGGGRFVEAGGMRLIDAIPSDAPIHGVYVVRNMGQSWRVLAKLADVSLLAPTATTASPIATPTPTAAPPATPVVPPTGAIGAAPIGLMSSGNRPLTEDEFATLWAADPAHLAGRIAIVKGPVPTGFECWSGGAADAAVPAPGCHIAILDGWVAQDGYWAVRVGTDGKITVVGEIAVQQTSYVFTLEQALAVWDKPALGDLLIVDALLGWANDCDLPTEPPANACGYSQLTSEYAGLDVRPDDAYQLFGSKDVGQAIQGLYLVDGATATILARLEVATP